TPRTIYEDPEGWIVRDLVPGEVWPDGLRQRLLADPDRARRMGADIGAILAEQHTRIRRKDIEGWLPSAPDWPRAIDLPHLPNIVGDAALLARIDAALARYDTMAAETDDVVLAHADLGFHNIAVEPGTDRLMGVFDYDGAIAGDRYHDFKYLFLGDDDSTLLDAAATAYEPLAGVTIDLSRVRLFHAVAAIAFLAHRNGHAPEELWCGRTLDQDLAWTGQALGAAGF
ncbi:MAG: phosphotransferase, partial [Maricaulaceae bacterium]